MYFHQGNFTFGPEYLYRLDQWSATASVECELNGGLTSYPDQIDITWGINPIDESDTAAKGKAFKGFDVLVSCCEL